MEVPAAGYWLWYDHPGGVHRRPDVFEITPPRDLLDEDGGETLRPEFLVDAEEVDFWASEVLVSDPDGDGDAGDEGAELFGGFGAHADVPLG